MLNRAILLASFAAVPLAFAAQAKAETPLTYATVAPERQQSDEIRTAQSGAGAQSDTGSARPRSQTGAETNQSGVERALDKTGEAIGDGARAIGRGANDVANEVDQELLPDKAVGPTDLSNAVAVDTLVDPRNTLRTANLRHPDGKALGEFHDVVIGANGKVTAVQIEVGGTLGIDEKIVQLPVSAVKYVRNRDILITTLSVDQLKALPGVAKRR